MGESESNIEYLSLRKAEKMLDGTINRYTEMITNDVINDESQKDVVELFIKMAEEAKEKLKEGDVSKAVELITLDLENARKMKEHFIDPTGKEDEIKEAENKIRRLGFLKSELEQFL